MNVSRCIHKVAFLIVTLGLAACGGSGGSAGTGGANGGTNSAGGTISIQMGGAVQGSPLSLTGSSASFAGTTASSDGTGAAARFSRPNGVVSDGINLYVVDTANSTVRQVVIATGAVSTLAGSAGVTGSSDGVGAAASFNNPYGITINNGALYVCDTGNDTVRRIALPSGTVTTVAGSAGQVGATDGVGAAARFNSPTGIATDGGPSLVVADSFNNTVRRIDIQSATVTTLAGSGSADFADGTGTSASFSTPLDVACDGANVYVSDNGNGAIRSIALTASTVSTLVQPGAGISSPAGIATDGTTLYVSDAALNRVLSVDIATQAVATVAGDAVSGAAGSADGTGGGARFNQPAGLAFDGDLYLADAGNGTIRNVTLGTGAVSTLAGTAAGSDGTGAAASFNSPYDLATNGSYIYVADAGSNTVRKISCASGAVTTVAGSAGLSGSTDGTGAAARFNFPSSVTMTATDLYVADSGNHTIRKVSLATGAVTTIAGSPGNAGLADGTGTAAQFNNPGGITTDGTNLYVSDSDNNAIRKISIATGAVTTLVGASAGLSSPYGITTDGTSLYFADSGNNAIRVVTIATGAVSTLSISGGTLNFPTALTTDGTSLYVADSGNKAVKKVVIATGAVTTVSGGFQNPSGITSDGSRLYVADADDNLLTKLW